MAGTVSFTPLKDFADADLGSAYCTGLNYTVRPGDNLLSEKLQGWLESGRARLGVADKPSEAKIGGAGTIE